MPNPSYTMVVPRSLLALIRVFCRVFCGALIATALACNTDVSMPGPVDVSDSYWTLRINHPAIQLSTAPGYNTVQLEAVAYTPFNEPWQDHAPGTTTITTSWMSSDSLRVHVSPTGVATALRTTTGNGISIYVARQIDGVTHVDTARVKVSDLTDPPVIGSLRIRPTDSTKRAANLLGISLPTTILDTANNPITGLPVANLTTLNPRDARFAPYKWDSRLDIKFLEPTKMTIISSTYAYGIAKADTFELDVGATLSYFYGFPSVTQIVIEGNKPIMQFLGKSHVLGPGGVLQWENNSGIRPAGFTGPLLPAADIDVIFDDTTGIVAAPINSGGGNILGIPSDSTLPAFSRQRYRQFQNPGVYHYTIMPYGFRGVVRVFDR